MIVPVVFSTDENYVPYMGVALHSLIRHTSPGHEYRVYILAGGDVPPAGRKRLLGMSTGNVQVEIVDMASYFDPLDIPKIDRFSKEAAGRLLVDKLFPQYEKMLYLDCDIIVNRDVAELYQTDIQDYILGAALDMPKRTLCRHIVEDLGLSVETYFNSGVLLVNLPLFREYGIGDRALSMLAQKASYWPDQDALNLLCRGRVKYIDGRWNVIWGYLRSSCGVPPEVAAVRGDVFSCYENPYIIHYTSDQKPWAHPEAELADYFWENARGTVFYHDILFRNIGREEDPFAYYRFPWKLIKPDSRILLYGGGGVGRAFLQQLQKTGYCTVCAVCDRDPSGVEKLPVPVIGIGEIHQYDYDDILIAIRKESVAREIRGTLLGHGIPEERIKWAPME